MNASSFIEIYRRSGVLAFCPNCGSNKKGYRKACKSCGATPLKDDLLLARSILLSTEQYYMRSTQWENMTPVENKGYIERELVPKLMADAARLKNAQQIKFNSEEEDYWTQRIKKERTKKTPKSAIAFFVIMGILFVAIIIFFLKRFIF